MSCAPGEPADENSALFDESEPADQDPEDNHASTAHDRLLQSINQLDSKHGARFTAQRSEPSVEVSEFHMATGDDAGINVDDLLSSLGDKARHATLHKNVKRAAGHGKLPAPLQKPQATQLQRKTGYEKVTKEVSRWEGVVNQQRRAPHVSFPLEKPDLRVETATQRTAAFTAQTPLELEIAALLGNSSSVVQPGEVLSEAEQRALAAVSLDEALERRRMLAKHRALITYQEAKNRRQNKIKSRKYHRILKKERIKQHLQEFERLKVCDPQAALAKLQQMERDRAEERVSQKHRNTGKWARMMALKRKYDPAAREALAENLRINRERTQKTAQQLETIEAESSDNDVDDDDDDDNITAADMGAEPENPWIGDKPPVEDALAAYSGEYTRFWSQQEAAKRRLREAERAEEAAEADKCELPLKAAVSKTVVESGSENEQEELVEAKVETKKKSAKRKAKPVEEKGKKKKKVIKEIPESNELSNGKAKKKMKTKKRSKTNKPTEDIDEIFDDFEKKIVKKTEKKLKKLTDKKLKKKKISKDAPKAAKKSATEAGTGDESAAPAADGVSNMDESLVRRSTTEDLESLAAAEKEPAAAPLEELAAPQDRPSQPEVPQLDPSQFLKMQPRQLMSLPPSAEGDHQTLENDSARLTIAEAFADDDVVAEFREEKEATVEADRPKDVDMALPGWGDWGGKDIKVSARKKRRLMFRAPKAGPRKDHSLGHVILSEKRNEALRAHQPSQLPHYVRSVAAFEAMVRAPVGSTWLPSAAHRKLTEPEVTTRAGTIIPPMDESVLLQHSTNTTAAKQRRRKPV